MDQGTDAPGGTKLAGGARVPAAMSARSARRRVAACLYLHTDLLINEIVVDEPDPAATGATPLKIALDTGNIHHFLVGAQGALPVDAVGNPWSGSYVYNSGNLVLDLLYNLMLESTGRLQKCRIYEMTDNKAARSTIA